jgi:hypothetical protein
MMVAAVTGTATRMATATMLPTPVRVCTPPLTRVVQAGRALCKLPRLQWMCLNLLPRPHGDGLQKHRGW